ncbi:MAG: hypothetical protein LBK71_05805, partial [Verrucomicrobiales bacterium]|jgi:hypothetical protein|nr:hypothetical protein [Verrucomicrobiales bacterium]
LTAWARDGFEFYPGNRRPDFQFHGYNDNMPAEASMGLILGGQFLGCREAVEYGRWNLLRLRDILRRRGTISEWNSPTYTPITLHAMAELASHAADGDIRELALKIEQRLWLDFAARFHPEIGALAGPPSRAYTVDELAYVTIASSLLWFALGDASRISPLVLFDDRQRDELVLHHEGDVAFNVAQMAMLSMADYHMPAAAKKLFREKKYPFRAVATAEMGDGGLEFPARPVRIESWLQRDYAVGTASNTWLGGGSAREYYVLYKRNEPVQSRHDSGVIFHKMFLNDERPGSAQSALNERGEPYAAAGERYLNSQGNALTVQDGPTALVVSSPKVTLGNLECPEKAVSISAINDMVLFPSHFGGADEIIVGDRQRANWAGGVAHGEWIGCRRGRLLAAYRMLTYLPDERHPAVTLEKINDYEVIRTTLYQGAARTFTPNELRVMFSGFVAEHASVDEYPSLAAFVKSLAAAKFTDFHWTTRRVRYRRPACKQRPALELELSQTPGATTTRYALVNGALVESPRVQIDGLADADFPFLTEPWESIPSHFPWPHFNTPWGKGIVSDAEK